jgi:DNA-binding transcriptional LysR family regulator
VLTLHQLQVFSVVVAEGGFSAAARRLGLTQPAVSLQVRGLEEHFGAQLLERSGRAVRLTDAGQQAYAYATRLLDVLADMESAMRSDTDRPAGRLHVGASTTPGEWLLPRLLPHFREQYPDVQLTVEVSDTAAVLEQVLRRQCDVGLVGGVAHAERLDFVPFAQDELVLVAAANHPLARGGAVAPAELGRYSFVFREAGSGTRAAAERALEQLGVTGLPVSMVLGSSEAVKQAVAAGVGLAVVSACSLGDGDAGRLVVVPVGWRYAASSTWRPSGDGRPGASWQRFSAGCSPRPRTSCSRGCPTCTRCDGRPPQPGRRSAGGTGGRPRGNPRQCDGFVTWSGSRGSAIVP